MVGDPSGRTDMRTLMTKEEIMENGKKFERLFGRYIDFKDGKGILDNNADWLLDLNYVSFLRDIGKHFSVNNMLRADCYKQRLEKGLSFLELNYMLMQAYDFLVLSRKYDCKMQCGGNDQWSNILAGIDLTRREDGKQVYGMVYSLLTTSTGTKMGKTLSGALWLDAAKTSPYEFYQYWRNIEDADVRKCLCLLTFLPMEEVNELSALSGEEINKAKEVLAFEVTKLIHGEEEAEKAQQGARAVFGGGGDIENIPTTKIEASEFSGGGMGIVKLLQRVGLSQSSSDGFRTIEQGGLTVNDEKITDTKLMIKQDSFKNGKLLIKKGKKTYHMVELWNL
jgi:tyrosyl-tRNA synthetase